MSDYLFRARFEYSPKWYAYSAVWFLHSWCHAAKLLPPRRVLCTQYQVYTKPDWVAFILGGLLWSLQLKLPQMSRVTHLHLFCVHHTTMHHVTSYKATYVRCMCV